MMRTTILNHLDAIEKERRVKIILACESGSRAWGFPSQDSDYDVRFVYAHPTDWYLSVHKRRDVIELPVDKVLDISGWDLRKALQLMRKSNPPLLEWLASPIRYRCIDPALRPITALAQTAFQPESACHHYLAMAQNSIARFPAQGPRKAKAYMYALRTVLCCQWIIARQTAPPMLMADLLAAGFIDEGLKTEIQTLIALKAQSTETFTIDKSAAIEDFLEAQITRLKPQIPKNPPKPEMTVFNRTFREVLAIM